jgi:hypothetical protein
MDVRCLWNNSGAVWMTVWMSWSRENVLLLPVLGLRTVQPVAWSLYYVKTRTQLKKKYQNCPTPTRFSQWCNTADVRLGYLDEIMTTNTFRQIYSSSAYPVSYVTVPPQLGRRWLRFRDPMAPSPSRLSNPMIHWRRRLYTVPKSRATPHLMTLRNV